jgi:predicted dienelactone hydrolase
MKLFLGLVAAILSASHSLAVMAQQQPIRAPREDGARTPIYVYTPESGANCAPLALISPGAGGSESGMSYLAQSLSEEGWLAIVLGHEDDKPVRVKGKSTRDALLQVTTDPEAYRGRLLDIGAALKWIGQPCRTSFAALIGHSMGAATVMLEAGAKNKLDVDGDDRFDAYVALSPQGPGSIFPENAWKKVRKPLLLLTGTRDKALDGDWKSRTIPFDDLPPGCKWLGVIEGATHLNFAGIGPAGRTEKLTLQVVNAFLGTAHNSNCVIPPPKAKGLTVKSK